jgi:hypothetical protein
LATQCIIGSVLHRYCSIRCNGSIERRLFGVSKTTLKVLCHGHRVVPLRAALSNVGTTKKKWRFAKTFLCFKRTHLIVRSN